MDPVDVYERLHLPLTEACASDLVALLGLRTGEAVLDVGTGTGAGAVAAVDAGAGTAVGVDPTAVFLERARRRHPRLPLVRGDALVLPFADRAFDGAIANFLLALLPDPGAALDEMRRVLRPGGRVAVSWWDDRGDVPLRTWRRLVGEAVGGEAVEGVLDGALPWRRVFGDPGGASEALSGSGFADIRTTRHTYRSRLPQETYLRGKETEHVGRLARETLGEDWEAFRSEARRVFAEELPDPLEEARDAVLAVGTKPG